MTLYAETSAVLRWLFAERDGEAVRTRLAALSKVTTSEGVLANASLLGFERESSA